MPSAMADETDHCELQSDCAFYIQSKTCKFGASCKFNHPEPTMNLALGNGRARIFPFCAHQGSRIGADGERPEESGLDAGGGHRK